MAEKKVRESVIAGSWYPGQKEELSSMIGGFLNKVDKLKLGKVRVLISPHAGYVYSGQVASYGYKQIEGEAIKKVIILAPSHYVSFRGASIVDRACFRTPLGDVRISEESKALLKETELVQNVPIADQKEHSLEIQLPFLQKAIGEFDLIPLVVGHITEEDAEEMAKVLLKHVDDSTLVVASTDLSHFYPYDTAVSMDNECIDSILDLNLDEAGTAEMCGMNPVLIAMNIARKLELKTRLLKYLNSGDVTGDHSGVVGYASIAFYVPDKNAQGEAEDSESAYSTDEKRFLLKLARDTIEEYVKNNRIMEPGEEEVPEKLRKIHAVFVTLEKNGQLRGCIGNLKGTEALYLNVRDNAINAAVHDPRFPPVREDEVDRIEIEISVLSEPALVKAKSPKEYLDRIKEGVDGIILEYKGRSATYLPQVWEQLPEKEEFLSSLCNKAGLPGDSWKKKGVKIQRYRVEAFSEREFR